MPPDTQPHRADELTRPIRLSTWALIGGAIVTAAMFGMLGFGIGQESSSAPPRTPPSRLAMIAPGVGASGQASLERQIAITPDGSAVIFVTQMENGENVLAYQRLDSETPVLISGARGLLSPRVSDEGRFVTGMAEDGTSSRVPLRGGRPAQVEEPDGRFRDALSAEGLELQQMLDRDRKALAIRAAPGSDAGTAVIREMRSEAETKLVEEPVVAARIAAEHLVYVREDGTLWAAPFDDDRDRLAEPAVQIGSGVALTGSGVAQLAVAPNGNLAWLPNEPSWLVLVNRAGRMRNLTPERRGYSGPRFAPDGNRVAVDFADSEGRDIWLVTLSDGSMSRATFARDAHDAAWTPDGAMLTWTSFRRGALGIYRSRPGVDAPADSLFTAGPLVQSGGWLGDGSGIVATATGMRSQSRLDIVLVSNGGRGPIVPVVGDGHETRFPVVSPDGKWLAYVSDETGASEVYVRTWADGGTPVRVSGRGGTEPVWHPGGSELFYRDAASQYLVAASLATSPELQVTARRSLFPIGEMVPGVTHANYDVSPDGRTFVMIRMASSSRIMVLQNLPGLVRELR